MPLRRRLSRLALALPLALFCAASARAQQRPLVTEDVDIIPPGSVRLEVGIDFMQDAKFPLSGLRGDLTRVGVVGVNVGLSPNVEFQLEGVLQNFVSINSRAANPAILLEIAPGANSTNDTGDFRLSTKIKLRNETRRAPALGFKFGVELPNSNEARGIGTNQTNAFGLLLVGKKFGGEDRLNLFGNLGLGIFAAPTRAFTQNDMLLRPRRHLPAQLTDQPRRRDQRARQHALGQRPARHRAPVGGAPRRAGQSLGPALRLRGHQGPDRLQPPLRRHLRRHLRLAQRIHPRQIKSVTSDR